MDRLQFDFNNIGGLLSVYAIPPELVSWLGSIFGQGLYHLTLSTTDGVICLHPYANDTYSFTEEQTDNDAGDGWSVTVEGVIPKQMIPNQEIIHRLERSEWLVVAEDQNGVIHLCGDLNTRMRFRTIRTSGASYTDRNQCSFKFTCLQENPTLILDQNIAEYFN